MPRAPRDSIADVRAEALCIHGDFSPVAQLIAAPARSDDVASGIATAITARDQVLRRALKMGGSTLGQWGETGQFFRPPQPHLVTAVGAAAALAIEGGIAVRYEFAGHE